MAKVIVTMKVMPESPEAALEPLIEKLDTLVAAFAGPGETKTEIEPIAFGLKAIRYMFVMDESKGSTEELEKSVTDLEGVGSVQTTDVRRAIG